MLTLVAILVCGGRTVHCTVVQVSVAHRQAHKFACARVDAQCAVQWNRASGRPDTLKVRVRSEVQSGALMSRERTIAGEASLRSQR